VLSPSLFLSSLLPHAVITSDMAARATPILLNLRKMPSLIVFAP
jgi:hypothetical protein